MSKKKKKNTEMNRLEKQNAAKKKMKEKYNFYMILVHFISSTHSYVVCLRIQISKKKKCFACVQFKRIILNMFETDSNLILDNLKKLHLHKAFNNFYFLFSVLYFSPLQRSIAWADWEHQRGVYRKLALNIKKTFQFFFTFSLHICI